MANSVSCAMPCQFLVIIWCISCNNVTLFSNYKERFFPHNEMFFLQWWDFLIITRCWWGFFFLFPWPLCASVKYKYQLVTLLYMTLVFSLYKYCWPISSLHFYFLNIFLMLFSPCLELFLFTNWSKNILLTEVLTGVPKAVLV